MTRLIRSEYLKFRTTRAGIGFVLVILALTGIGTAGTVGSAEEARLGTVEFSRDIVSAVVLSSIIVFLVGIVSVTSEWRHGTVTRTFLVAPRRAQVILAKELWVGLLAVAMAAVALVLVVSIAVVWLAAEGSPSLAIDSGFVRYTGRLFLLSVLWGMLGVGIGAVVQSQTVAVVGSVIWVLLVEALIEALLGLLDLGGAADYLPGRALSAFDGTEGGLSTWAGGAVAAGWVVALGTLGVLRTSRQDIA